MFNVMQSRKEEPDAALFWMCFELIFKFKTINKHKTVLRTKDSLRMKVGKDNGSIFLCNSRNLQAKDTKFCMISSVHAEKDDCKTTNISLLLTFFFYFLGLHMMVKKNLSIYLTYLYAINSTNTNIVCSISGPFSFFGTWN